MSLENKIARLFSLAALHVEKSKGGVTVSLANTKIHDIPMKRALEEAKANPDNFGTYGSRAGIYTKLKPEIAEKFKDACKEFTAEAPLFSQAISQMFEEVTRPGKLLEIGFLSDDGGTEYRYFKYDSERAGFFKAQPEDFKP